MLSAHTFAFRCKLCQHLVVPKSNYHHGDLANALVAAALKLVEQDGEAAVSLRDLAQSLGVSRAAPYRHFADRDALLAAVAAEGFEDLNRRYAAALEGPGDGKARLSAATAAFFGFAYEKPGLYRLMFESDLLGRAHPPAVLIPPADRSYQLLQHAVAGAHPEADEAEIKRRTLVMMATGHGFLALDRGGRIKPFMITPMTREDMVDWLIVSATGLD
jgi:AcrR family transcriptional regulator